MWIPAKSWQMTTQGISTFAHKGMLLAAEVMAGAIELYKNPSALEAVQKEHQQFIAKSHNFVRFLEC